MKKVKIIIGAVLAAIVLAGIGIGIGKQGIKGYPEGTQALAAGKTTEEKTESEGKQPAYFAGLDTKRIFHETVSGSLLKVAAYKIGQGAGEETSEDGTYEVISTHALAQEAMETLEQETLQLMASPVGSVWGGLTKVYAGETPLLITEEEKEVLLRIVEAEATCEDIKGRMLVANVILNRVVSDKFPDNVRDVVFQNNGETYQFAPIKDGRYWTVTVSEETMEAVERVLLGEDYSRGAMYFAARGMANPKAMRWFDSSLTYLFKHGVHEFFAEK